MRYVPDGPERPDWHDKLKNGTDPEMGALPYIDTVSPVTGETFSYWREREHFVFTETETGLIGEANAAIWDALIKGCERLLDFERACHWDPANPNQRDPYHRDRDCYFRKLGIPDWAIPGIMRTWQLDETNGDECVTAATEHYPCIYGRYDFSVQLDAFGNIIGVKLLEFNADTPTALVESAIQWYWFTALHQGPGRDQWNTVFEGLVDRWIYELSEYRQKTQSLPPIIHVAFDRSEQEGEDKMTCTMMEQALIEASYRMGTGSTSAFMVKLLPLQDISFVQEPGNPTVPDGPLAGTPIGHFVDDKGEKISMIFKLLPWEHLLVANGDYGKAAMYDIMSDDPTIWVEPPYKLLWSNKGILAVLWEFFKNDERYSRYLLPAYFKGDPDIPEEIKRNCVEKPIFSREGANARVIVDGVVVETGHNYGYGDEGWVVQALAPLPTFEDPAVGTIHAVIGSWMMGDTGTGICVRASQTRITDNQSWFLPHCFETGV